MLFSGSSAGGTTPTEDFFAWHETARKNEKGKSVKDVRKRKSHFFQERQKEALKKTDARPVSFAKF